MKAKCIVTLILSCALLASCSNTPVVETTLTEETTTVATETTTETSSSYPSDLEVKEESEILKKATFYRDGNQVEKDPQQYRHWLEQAAIREHPMAMSELGDILASEGETEKAMELFKHAAEGGDFDSRRKYASMFGEVHQEIEELRDVLRSLAETGYPYDLYNYGNMMYRSALVPEDYEEAFKYVSMASEAGWADADYLLGQMYRDGTGTERSIEKAVAMFTQAGNTGHMRAITTLADMYNEGRYVERDYAKAFQWFMRAAEAGHLKSQYQVASMYHRGLGVEKDEDQARQWYSRYASCSFNDFRRSAMDSLRSRSEDREISNNLLKASSRSLHVQSMVALAGKYGEGRDFKKNKEASVSLLTRASAAGGSPRTRLGELYLEGDGVEKDTDKAFELFLSASKYGDASGMYHLALMYKDGISCEESQVKYRMYMRMAAEQGNRDARAIVSKWDGRIERRKAKKDQKK